MIHGVVWRRGRLHEENITQRTYHRIHETRREYRCGQRPIKPFEHPTHLLAHLAKHPAHTTHKTSIGPASTSLVALRPNEVQTFGLDR